MEFDNYEYRLGRPIKVKVGDLMRQERLQHCIFSAQFDIELLEYLGSVADTIRQLAKTKDGHNFLISLLPH